MREPFSFWNDNFLLVWFLVICKSFFDKINEKTIYQSLKRIRNCSNVPCRHFGKLHRKILHWANSSPEKISSFILIVNFWWNTHTPPQYSCSVTAIVALSNRTEITTTTTSSWAEQRNRNNYTKDQRAQSLMLKFLSFHLISRVSKRRTI